MNSKKKFVKPVYLVVSMIILVGLSACTNQDEYIGYCIDLAYDNKTGRMLVTTGGAEMIHVLDVSDGRLDYGTTCYTEKANQSILVRNDRAFVGASGGLAIYDISGDTPVETWSQGLSEEIPGMGLFIDGDVLYLTTGLAGKTVYVFDIAHPDAPTLLSSKDTLFNPWDVWVKNNYAYVGDDKLGIVVYDVTDPSLPTEVGAVAWSETTNIPEIVRGEGNIVCTAAGVNGLLVLDITDPVNPVVASQYNPGESYYGEGICIKDGIIYATIGNADNDSQSSLVILDARDPYSLSVMSSYPLQDWPEGVCLVGNHLYVALTRSGVLSFDVTDREKPVLVDVFSSLK